MKKQFTIFLAAFLVLFAALPIAAQTAEVTSQLVDEGYDIALEVLQDDSDDISATSQYISSTAKVIVEDEKTYVVVTLNSSEWWQSLKTQETQPGSFEDTNFIDAETLSEDETENTRVVKFEVQDLEQVLNAKIHIIVTGVPGMGTYDKTYNIRLKFSDSETVETPEISEPEANEGTEELPTPEVIADGDYTIDVAVLHETKDEPSRMGSYISSPVLLTIEDGSQLVTLTLTNNEQISAFQVEQDDAYVDATVVAIDEENNTRTISFEVADLSQLLNTNVQVHVAAQNYTSDHVVRLAFDQESIEPQLAPVENITFSDISTSWAKEYIETLASQEIIKGITEDVFAPDDNITRAQFAVLLSRALDLPNEAYEGTFSDVGENVTWAVYGVEAAHRANIVFGFDDGTFNPDDKITREQMVTMVVRAIEHIDASLLDGVTSQIVFADEAAIHDYAKQHVSLAVGLELINGINVNEDVMFAPTDNATRAQAAKVVYYLLEIL